MSFEKIVRIPTERVGSLVGKSGKAKARIEKACSVSIEVDGASGEVRVYGEITGETSEPFKAIEIVMAIGRGFSPDSAMHIMDGGALHIMDLREIVGKSRSQIERVKGRIIGQSGRARRNMEELSETQISVYGRTVAVIGAPEKIRVAVNAINALSNGSMHGSVYRRLESARRRQKLERLKLWEDQDV